MDLAEPLDYKLIKSEKKLIVKFFNITNYSLSKVFSGKDPRKLEVHPNFKKILILTKIESRTT
jgi:hypothetical protein